MRRPLPLTSLPTGARGPLLAFVAFGLFAGSWSALLPTVRDNAHASATAMAVSMFAVGIGAVPAMVISGPALDRFGGRVVGLALALLAATVYIASLSGSAHALVGAMVLVGFAGGATDIAMNAAVSHAEAGTRPLMNLAHALFSIGAAAGGALTGVAREAGFAAPDVTAILGAIIIGAALANRSGASVAAEASDGTHAGRSTPRVTGWLVAVGLLVALSFIAEGTMFSWSAIHLVDTFGASEGTAGIAVALYFSGSVVGRLAVHVRGAMLDARLLLVASGAVLAVGAGLLAGSPSVAPAILACLLVGLGTAAVAPTLYGIAGGSDPARRGASIATVAMLGYAGNLAGPFTAGLVADASSLRVSFGLVAGAGVLLAVGSAATLRGHAATVLDERAGAVPDHLGVHEGGIVPHDRA